MWGMAVGLLAACLAGNAAARDLKQAAKPATCGEFGTSLHFEATPSQAARKALKEQKLVFVLHVSGIFEDPNLT
jgi:hypothetical protein